MNGILKADAGIDAFLWVLFIVLWLIARVVTSAMRKARPAPRPPPVRQPPPRPAEDFDRELKRFLETLGVEAQPMPPPPTRPAPHPAAPRPRVRAPARRAPLAADARASAAPGTPRETPPGGVPATGMAEAAALRKATSSLQSAAESIRMIVRLPSSRMPTVSSGSLRTGAGGPNPLRPRWRSRQDIRQAMVNHVILGPPLALQRDPHFLADGPR